MTNREVKAGRGIMSHARWLIALPSGLLSVLMLSAASGRAPDAGSCNSVAEWVDAHRAELPTRYEDLIKYPLIYRKKIQAALPLAAQRDAWLDQYRTYRASGLLTERQKTFLLEAEGAIRFVYDETNTATARGHVADSITARAIAVLGRDLTHRIVFVLGPEDAKRDADVALFRVAMAHPVNVPPVASINCTCHVLNGGGIPSPPECYAPMHCEASSCTLQERGCGSMAAFSCNGDCKYAE